MLIRVHVKLWCTCYLDLCPDIVPVCALPSDGAKGSYPNTAQILWLKDSPVGPLCFTVRGRNACDTPNFILVTVSLKHTVGLHASVSLKAKLMHNPVET